MRKKLTQMWGLSEEQKQQMEKEIAAGGAVS